jgi:elongation factor G
MKRYAPSHIRNVVLVGHSGAGKTTLAEALLHRAGVTSRMGRVDQGTTVCDYDPEEQRRGLSLSLAMAPFEWKDHKINLIDTPGYADFVGDVIAALRVCDLAIFVVSAVEGVQVQTEAVWKLANKMNVPRMVFVNKLDLERADFQSTLAQLHSRFGAGIAPIELPIGEGPSFKGIADLLTDTAYLYDGGTVKQAEIPAEMEALEHEVHESLVEGIVVADEELLERYLEGDVPGVEELEATLAKGVAEASVFPVVLGSALAESAIDRLADFICEIGPSPVDRPVTVQAGAQDIEVKANESGEPLAFVFKSIADQYVGQVSLFKVISGTIKPDQHLINTRSSSDERLHGLFALRGKEQVPMTELVAGDLGAVAKLSNTETSDTLAPKGKPVVVPRIDQPAPSLAIAIVPKTQPDEDKLGNVLHRIQHEDPAIVVERAEETHQTLLRGTGETHLSVTLEKIQRKFGVNVDTEDVRVPYRETITGTADAEGKHKKQSGGHGQFAVCNLKMAPRDRGAGFEFIDNIVGGAIPRSFIPAVEKGIIEAMASGGVFGYPVVDVSVTLYDGTVHSVDSNEASFKMAARLGFREAMAKASPVLLEPISRIEVTVPSDKQGDVMGDLNTRRGRVQGSEALGDGEHVILALVPTSETTRYAIDLRSITGGRGRFTAEHAHYDIMPAHLVDKVKRTVKDE